MFGEIKTITEFNNNSVAYGIYGVEFNGRKETFVRNGNSVGVITFYLGGMANECVSIVRDDVATKFIEELARGKSTPAVGKETPVKPTNYCGYACRVCNGRLARQTDLVKQNYCHHCGQKVDWS